MRPVNLIPPEDRRGDRAPLRTGPLSYVVVGALVAVLLGVVAVVTTQNTIADRESEIASLEAREAEATARAVAVAPYAEFAALSQARLATVTSLAQSRFDWERVMHELALILPEDIWLTSLTGTVVPGVPLEGGADSSLRQEAPGPALSMTGCGTSHEAVARFLEDLKDIDGVTRVGITKSEVGSKTPDADAASAGDSGTGCRTRNFISEFDAVAAFDEVTVSVEGAEPTPPAPSAGGSATTTGVTP